MKNIIYNKTMIAGAMVIAFVLSSCVKDLDREPFVEITSVSVYKDPANYKKVLAKIYAGLALSGQQGPAGKPDISGIDEGFSTYLRQYWKAQELPTDEAVIAWNDGSLADYHKMNWASNNEFIAAMYNRIYYQVGLCNEFLRESTDAKLSDRGIGGSDADNIRIYRQEARFMRALSYWHALDMFGNVPFVTENDGIGAFLPKQATRAELFAFIESELKDIEGKLIDPHQNEYGRADKGAAWTLLAKLYLNAEVYINEPRYTDAIAYCKKVISAGYQLDPQYKNLFLADNNNSPEIIFPIVFDGVHTKTWGGITFLVHAPVGGSMNPADFGINGGWAGLRTTKSIVALYPDSTGQIDKRAMFYTTGQNIEINNVSEFKDGWPVTKYKNVTSAGVKGSDIEGNFPDTDFPMFRLADVYLMYAEAVKRGGAGGDEATAIGYVNQIRERAYGNSNGDISSLSLDFLLDERARELVWEGHRRTDLIRFGKFTGDAYLWPWKGNVKEGASVPPHLVLFPIPAADLIANPTLEQNLGYPH